jgi:hypothetical protein
MTPPARSWYVGYGRIGDGPWEASVASTVGWPLRRQMVHNRSIAGGGPATILHHPVRAGQEAGEPAGVCYQVVGCIWSHALARLAQQLPSRRDARQVAPGAAERRIRSSAEVAGRTAVPFWRCPADGGRGGGQHQNRIHPEYAALAPGRRSCRAGRTETGPVVAASADGRRHRRSRQWTVREGSSARWARPLRLVEAELARCGGVSRFIAAQNAYT